jgi:hypothetical protein
VCLLGVGYFVEMRWNVEKSACQGFIRDLYWAYKRECAMRGNKAIRIAVQAFHTGNSALF